MWYRSQQTYIQWGYIQPAFFTLSTVVRQGETLSPKIFSV